MKKHQITSMTAWVCIITGLVIYIMLMGWAITR